MGLCRGLRGPEPSNHDYGPADEQSLEPLHHRTPLNTTSPPCRQMYPLNRSYWCAWAIPALCPHPPDVFPAENTAGCDRHCLTIWPPTRQPLHSPSNVARVTSSQNMIHNLIPCNNIPRQRTSICSKASSEFVRVFRSVLQRFSGTHPRKTDRTVSVCSQLSALTV